LELLAKHPRIDSNRVMVMGFSRGGGAAHWSALKRFLKMHGPDGGLMFAGHIALYPVKRELDMRPTAQSLTCVLRTWSKENTMKRRNILSVSATIVFGLT
jgi:dienelactone hydrolase